MKFNRICSSALRGNARMPIKAASRLKCFLALSAPHPRPQVLSLHVPFKSLQRRERFRAELALVLGLGMKKLHMSAPLASVHKHVARGAVNLCKVLLVVNIAKVCGFKLPIALRAAVGRPAAVYAHVAEWH